MPDLIRRYHPARFSLSGTPPVNENNIVKFPQRIAFDTTQKGTPRATIENLEKLLKAYQITVRYNLIYKDIEIEIPELKLPIEAKFDCATAHLSSLSNEYGMPPGHLDRFLVAIAHKNRRNPVKEWIDSEKWDGVSRLDEFFATVEAENRDMKNLFIRKWMIGALAAAYREGISMAGVLVFQGDQYIGKTQWFKNLVPVSCESFRKDGLHLDLKNKDSLIYCFSRWLVELGEIPTTFKRSETDALKAFLTSENDLLRTPYAKSFSSFPRTTVFFGSVNDRKYLSDPTGNRRFWTVACKKINHTHGMHMQQIWAEIKVLYEDGESWFFTNEEVEDLNKLNAEHEVIDPLMEKLMVYYACWDREGKDWRTATQILETIGYKNPTRGDATKCALLVRKLNGAQARRQNGLNELLVPGARL